MVYFRFVSLDVNSYRQCYVYAGWFLFCLHAIGQSISVCLFVASAWFSFVYFPFSFCLAPAFTLLFLPISPALPKFRPSYALPCSFPILFLLLASLLLLSLLPSLLLFSGVMCQSSPPSIPLYVRCFPCVSINVHISLILRQSRLFSFTACGITIPTRSGRLTPSHNRLKLRV